MKLDPFTGPGSTPSRRRFWDQARESVLSLRKAAGRNVTVDEHEGKGTFVNIADTSSRRAGGGAATGACCKDGTCEVLTEVDCISIEGDYQGDGTGCEPNPCCPHVAIEAIWPPFPTFTLCGVCDATHFELDFQFGTNGAFETDDCELHDSADAAIGVSNCHDFSGGGGDDTCNTHDPGAAIAEVDYVFNDDGTYDISVTLTLTCGGCCVQTYTLTRTAEPFAPGLTQHTDLVTQDPICDLHSNFVVSVTFS